MQDLRSYQDLIKNYGENDVIFSTFLVFSVLTKRAYRLLRKSC